MDDDKILKEIKDSAEQVEIPQSLQPEEIRRRLEKEGRRKKILSYNKYIRWAAAVAVLVVVVLAAMPVIKKQEASVPGLSQTDAAVSQGITGNTEALPRVRSDAEETAEEAEGAADTDAGAAVVNESSAGGNSGILHVTDYNELYSIVNSTAKGERIGHESSMTGMENEFAITDNSESGINDIQEIDGGTYTTQPYNPTASNQEAALESSADGNTTAVTGNSASVTGKMAFDSANAALDTASKEYSSTNVQEKNVDEADIVKTDGKYIYILDTGGTVRIIEAETMELAGKISFEGEDAPKIIDMYVDGDVLQLIWSGYDYVLNEEDMYLLEDEDDNSREEGFTSEHMIPRGSTRTYYSVPSYFTQVLTYDISDRSAPQKKGTYRQDGRYLTSRKNGEYLYVFTTFRPEGGHGVKSKRFYVPRAGDIYLPCESIYLPGMDREVHYAGESYLVAASLKNSDASNPVDRMAVVNGAGTFYVSEENIYTAVSGYDNGLYDGSGDCTELTRFGYRDGVFSEGSAGRIPGTLNNNFSMDEYEGKLRTVTTYDREVKRLYPNETEWVRSNGLYVLDSNLKVIGEIEDLAEGESIESARFMGDTGYFVTYRNTDPLFSVDLSDPENPQVLGELKITGFSEYLHFYGENRLLGLGWETDPQTGERIGLKCSMFDISDPADVRETDRLVLDDVNTCEALDNYRAILADPEKNIFGFTYTVMNEENWEELYYYGIFTYEEDSGFRPLDYMKLPASIANGYMQAMRVRGLYIGDTFYLAGGRGIISYDMKEDFRKKGSFIWN